MLEPEHRYVILGASGSGKSTLIRLLNRLEDPAGGTIRLGDVPLASLPVLLLRRRIALVLQAPRPLPGTLGDNLDYPHLVRGVTAAGPDRQHAALGEVGLDPAGSTATPGPLSGGERQRLALATALQLDPEILVLDEPTAALDPASARQVARLLDDHHQSPGLRTIVVTHDRHLAPLLGDRGIRLQAGEVVDTGAIRDVLDRTDPKGGNA